MEILLNAIIIQMHVKIILESFHAYLLPNKKFIQFPLLIREFLNARVNFTIFCWNGLLLLFSRLIREVFSAGTN